MPLPPTVLPLGPLVVLQNSCVVDRTCVVTILTIYYFLALAHVYEPIIDFGSCYFYSTSSRVNYDIHYPGPEPVGGKRGQTPSSSFIGQNLKIAIKI